MAQTEYEYIIDSTSLKERYDRICAIIEALENQQLAAAGNTDVEEYTLDDGQTKIKTVYRSPEQIAKAIDNYEKIKNRVLAQMTGTRIMRLGDAKSIRNYGNRNY